MIWCFKCTQVQAVLRRHWNQHNIQFGSSVGNHSDALRSASYTASSITEVQGCYSIDSHSEHMNGKGFHDIDPSMLKPDSPFAWQWSPPLPQPPINCIMLASSCRSNEWRFLLYICHTVFLYLWDWLDFFLCFFLISSLQDAIQKCTLIITTLLQTFCLTKLSSYRPTVFFFHWTRLHTNCL